MAIRLIYAAGINYAVMDDLTLGASYYDRNDEASFTETTEVDTKRIAAGAAYEYAPGVKLRGSVSHITVDNGADESDGVQVALGTELSF